MLLLWVWTLPFWEDCGDPLIDRQSGWLCWRKKAWCGSASRIFTGRQWQTWRSSQEDWWPDSTLFFDWRSQCFIPISAMILAPFVCHLGIAVRIIDITSFEHTIRNCQILTLSPSSDEVFICLKVEYRIGISTLRKHRTTWPIISGTKHFVDHIVSTYNANREDLWRWDRCDVWRQRLLDDVYDSKNRPIPS